jgi:hypothetical protein
MLLQCGRSREGLLADRRLRFVLAALIASGAADGFIPVTLSFAVLRVTGSAGRGKRGGMGVAGQAARNGGAGAEATVRSG